MRLVKKQFESCFVILFTAFGIGLLISVLLSIPLGLIIGYTSSLANFISGITAAAVTIFILSFKDGYHNYKFQWIQLFLAILLTFIAQLLLVIVIGHAAWISGPTILLARFIFNTKHPDLIGAVGSKEIVEEYRLISMIIAYWFFYAPLMALGKCLGRKKHQKDFRKL